jgi:phosphatidylserine decarboxylase
MIHCVKGHSYSVGELLVGSKEGVGLTASLFPSLAREPDRCLYYVVFYLSPADYHHYYTPTSVVLKERHHVIGLLNPVMPKYLLSHTVIHALVHVLSLDSKITSE